MKKTALVLLYTILSLSVYSQKIVENPGFGFTTTFNLKIKSIELRDTATVLSFHISSKGSIVVPKQTYIQPVKGQKLFITGAEGIPINKSFSLPASGEADYKLLFPKIDASVSRLDYGEEGAGASWFIYDIALREVPGQSVIPSELRSNWFNKKTGDWELSFFDSTAVYKKKVWDYSKVNLTKREGTIELKDNKDRVLLAVKPTIDGSYLIGEATCPQNTYVQNPDFGSQDEEGYKAPVFKYDSVNFSGYFKGYSPRIKQKTISIRVNDILAGKDYSISASLDEKGAFSAKLPLYYPHSVSINSVSTGQQVFLEPGKDLFVLFDSPSNSKLYMGKSGNVNRDLDKLDKFNSLDFSSISKKIPDLTSSQFKSECLDLMQKELDALDAFKKSHSIGTKAYQVKKRDIEFRFGTYLLQYNALIYQVTGKPVYNPENFTAEYYDFIKNEKMNDPLAVISTKYSDFMTQLGMTKFIRGESLTYSVMMKGLEDSGHSLTPEEKKLKEDLKIAENPMDNAAMANFFNQYGTKLSELVMKYNDQFKKFIPEIRAGTITFEIACDSLTKKGVNFTGDEKVIIEKRKIIDNLPAIVKRRETTKAQEKFNSDHQNLLDSLERKRSKITIEENLKRLGIEKGMAMDIFNAKIDFNQIVNELAPLSDEGLKSMQGQYKTPFIANYLVMCNKSTMEKIEANKKKRGSVLNEVPKVEKEKLFEELMKKYTGKVVLVDFWATWCGPCRNAIERIGPLKEEMSKENVVFVYIAAPSSPKQTYDRMVPGIKGEHYRVSNDEWGYLHSKFNINGIPHLVLVDKKGQVINPNLSYSSNETLKVEIEKRIKE